MSEEEKFTQDHQRAFQEYPTAANFLRSNVPKTLDNLLLVPGLPNSDMIQQLTRSDQQEYLSRDNVDVSPSNQGAFAQYVQEDSFSTSNRNDREILEKWLEYNSEAEFSIEEGGSITLDETNICFGSDCYELKTIKSAPPGVMITASGESLTIVNNGDSNFGLEHISVRPNGYCSITSSSVEGTAINIDASGDRFSSIEIEGPGSCTGLLRQELDIPEHGYIEYSKEQGIEVFDIQGCAYDAEVLSFSEDFHMERSGPGNYVIKGSDWKYKPLGLRNIPGYVGEANLEFRDNGLVVVSADDIQFASGGDERIEGLGDFDNIYFRETPDSYRLEEATLLDGDKFGSRGERRKTFIQIGEDSIEVLDDNIRVDFNNPKEDSQIYQALQGNLDSISMLNEPSLRGNFVQVLDDGSYAVRGSAEIKKDGKSMYSFDRFDDGIAHIEANGDIHTAALSDDRIRADIDMDGVRSRIRSRRGGLGIVERGLSELSNEKDQNEITVITAPLDTPYGHVEELGKQILLSRNGEYALITAGWDADKGTQHYDLGTASVDFSDMVPGLLIGNKYINEDKLNELLADYVYIDDGARVTLDTLPWETPDQEEKTTPPVDEETADTETPGDIQSIEANGLKIQDTESRITTEGDTGELQYDGVITVQDLINNLLDGTISLEEYNQATSQEVTLADLTEIRTQELTQDGKITVTSATSEKQDAGARETLQEREPIETEEEPADTEETPAEEPQSEPEQESLPRYYELLRKKGHTSEGDRFTYKGVTIEVKEDGTFTDGEGNEYVDVPQYAGLERVGQKLQATTVEGEDLGELTVTESGYLMDDNGQLYEVPLDQGGRVKHIVIAAAGEGEGDTERHSGSSPSINIKGEAQLNIVSRSSGTPRQDGRLLIDDTTSYDSRPSYDKRVTVDILMDNPIELENFNILLSGNDQQGRPDSDLDGLQSQGTLTQEEAYFLRRGWPDFQTSNGGRLRLGNYGVYESTDADGRHHVMLVGHLAEAPESTTIQPGTSGLEDYDPSYARPSNTHPHIVYLIDGQPYDPRDMMN